MRLITKHNVDYESIGGYLLLLNSRNIKNSKMPDFIKLVLTI